MLFLWLMQNLANHITELLKNHDCVIIPQFGGFVANYKPAFYNHETSLFVPPGKEISFNEKLIHNDGLLSQQIMKTEGCTFDLAIERINESLTALKEELKQNQKVIFKGLGTLKRNTEGYLEFAQDSANLLKSAYGLSSFHFNRLAAGEERKLKIVADNRNKNRSNLSRFSVAAAAALIIMFFLFPFKVSDTRQNHAGIVDDFDSLFEQTAIAKQTVPNDNLAEYTEPEIKTETENVAAIDDVVDEIPDTEAIETEVVPIVVVPEVQYHIIVASLATKDQAIAFVERHCKNQFPEYRIIESNGRYRVSIETFKDKTIAVPVLETFRDTNPRYKDAWLLTIKATV